MTIRFFILQAHYRSTLDFSNDALQAAEKGLRKILQAGKDLKDIANAAGIDRGKAGEMEAALAGGKVCGSEAGKIAESIYEALCDDLNTPVAISHIFDAVRIINSAKDRKMKISQEDMAVLLAIYDGIVDKVLGLKDEEEGGEKASATINGLMGMVLDQRKKAKEAKDWATSDKIRDELNALGITIKDTKDGTEWSL